MERKGQCCLRKCLEPSGKASWLFFPTYTVWKKGERNGKGRADLLGAVWVACLTFSRPISYLSVTQCGFS